MRCSRVLEYAKKLVDCWHLQRHLQHTLMSVAIGYHTARRSGAASLNSDGKPQDDPHGQSLSHKRCAALAS